MTPRPVLTLSCGWLLSGLAALAASAQPAIESALSFDQRTENRVFRTGVKPQWLPGGQRFWYRVQTGPKAHEFVLIDTTTGARQTAASLGALGLPAAQPLKSSTTRITLRSSQRTGEETHVTFRNQLREEVRLFWVSPEGERRAYDSLAAGAERDQHTFAGHVWLVTDPAGKPLAVVEASEQPATLLIDGPGTSTAPTPPEAPPKSPGTVSPDGRWSARLQQGVLTFHDTASGTATPVRAGLEKSAPLHPPLSWAPDSRALVAWSAPTVRKRQIRIVESQPPDQFQPRVKTLDYVKPGDPLPKPVPVLYRLTASGWTAQAIATELFPEPFTLAHHLDVTWAPDSREFYFDYNQRGHQVYRILAVDTATATVRCVVEETSATFIHYSRKNWRHWLHASGELVWMSERDGWCHLYLYDAATGRVKNRVTQGAWPVREVLHLNEAARQVWFLASGLRPGEDPYHLHLCRANLDGTGFVQLTEGDGNHKVEFSPDRQHFIATWSRPDHPPVTELRRSADGRLLATLEKADASALLATGWTLPERFVAKGRDGQTDIHGVIIRPSHLDPAKKYPVLEDIYAGPHSSFAPKDFDRLVRLHQMAELGFIVVKLDGMGTDHRGKAFHDVCWKNLKDSGFPDRKLWITAAAKTRPWMDLSRVGIYGGSAGGQSAMRALLDHPDFYHVAVADCGCHDNRMDKIWWNEQWMGWPIDDSYARNSNAVDAPKLQGRLLLIVGEVDTNVDPASTTQVVGALQKAGKSFDYQPIIGAGHGAAETPHGQRLRMEFLVRHLRPAALP